MSVDVHGLLRDLVRIESVSGNEDALAEFVVDWLCAHKIDARRLGNNVVAHVAGGQGPKLLFNSHLDTVPQCEGWEADPWQVDWKDGKLVGLGANDAKASVAAMLTMLVELDPSQINGVVQLALTCCEETSNRGMGEVLAELGPPDLAVTGEPTNLAVIRTQAGLGVLSATWNGEACHAAHAVRLKPHNAMIQAAEELAQFGPARTFGAEHPLIGHSTMVPTTFQAGERRNVVPDRATATFDVRLAPPSSAKLAAATLGEWLPSASIEILSERLPPVETADDHPLVRAGLKATGAPRAIGSPTLSDMALLAGIPAIKCGPGVTQRSHTANEFVTHDELAAAVRAYSKLSLFALPKSPSHQL